MAGPGQGDLIRRLPVVGLRAFWTPIVLSLGMLVIVLAVWATGDAVLALAATAALIRAVMGDRALYLHRQLGRSGLRPRHFHDGGRLRRGVADAPPLQQELCAAAAGVPGGAPVSNAALGDCGRRCSPPSSPSSSASRSCGSRASRRPSRRSPCSACSRPSIPTGASGRWVRRPCRASRSTSTCGSRSPGSWWRSSPPTSTSARSSAWPSRASRGGRVRSPCSRHQHPRASASSPSC